MMQRVSDGVDRASQAAIIIVLGCMAVVVFMQVIFRYLLHLPLFWTEEFARYCLIWISLLGAGVALKRGEHIAVTFLVERLPKGAARMTALMARISVLVMLIVVTWGGIKLVTITSAQISPALRIPMAIPYLALPIGSIIMLLHLVSSLCGSHDEAPFDPKTGENP